MMKNPAHPGALVRDNIDALGLTVSEAADGLGITRQQLYRIIRGQHGLTPEMSVRLEQAFGGPADSWLRMQMHYDLAKVRKGGAITVKRLEPKSREKADQIN